jgi:hypothetical protein
MTEGRRGVRGFRGRRGGGAVVRAICGGLRRGLRRGALLGGLDDFGDRVEGPGAEPGRTKNRRRR